jgi:acyl dehydratase
VRDFFCREYAGIWNPVHTERVVARDNALPDIVLHGTCTWAMAGQELVRRFADGDPEGLRRLAGRLHRMVIPGEEVHLEYAHNAASPRSVQFAVYNARGELAVASGIAQFA